MIHYCCFYYPFSAPGFAGQKNLSRSVHAILAAEFGESLHSTSQDPRADFPSVLSCLKVAHRLLLGRLSRTREVTVLDMIHSLSCLPKERHRDRIILVGHDSYALRAWRELRHSRPTLGWHKVRKAAAWAAWAYLEFLLRLVCTSRLYVSPIDRAAVGGKRSAEIAIPLSPHLLQSRPQSSSIGEIKRVLISTPVCNATQNAFDVEAIRIVHEITFPNASIVVWGAAADRLSSEIGHLAGVEFVSWVHDYISFVQSFDLLIYPRIIGSGFHTKIAEALVLGVQCVCAEWVARALEAVGYSGLSTFEARGCLGSAVRRALELHRRGKRRPHVPAAVHPQVALRPLVDACYAALADGNS